MAFCSSWGASKAGLLLGILAPLHISLDQCPLGSAGTELGTSLDAAFLTTSPELLGLKEHQCAMLALWSSGRPCGRKWHHRGRTQPEKGTGEGTSSPRGADWLMVTIT